MLYPIFELIYKPKCCFWTMQWQKSTPKGLNLTSIMLKFNPKWFEINVQRQKSQGPKFDSKRIKIEFQRLKFNSQRPKTDFLSQKTWLPDAQNRLLKAKVNSCEPKYKRETQNWMAEVQSTSRCLKVTPWALKSTPKGIITVPLRSTT